MRFRDLFIVRPVAVVVRTDRLVGASVCIEGTRALFFAGRRIRRFGVDGSVVHVAVVFLLFSGTEGSLLSLFLSPFERVFYFYVVPIFAFAVPLLNAFLNISPYLLLGKDPSGPRPEDEYHFLVTSLCLHVAEVSCPHAQVVTHQGLRMSTISWSLLYACM